MLAKSLQLNLLMSLSMVVLVSCSLVGNEPAPTATSESTPSGPVIEPASVQSIQIQQVEALPVEITVIAKGNLPDNCATVNQVHQERQGGTFNVTVEMIRPTDLTCTEGLVPFEKHIKLEVLGLPAGIYTVDVNGLKGTFTLQNDNVADDGNAVIGGRVWLDECVAENSGSDGSSDVPIGCVLGNDGRLVANGLLDPGEAGISGVVVDLGQGNCPSTGLATTITDQDGIILFSGLKAGTYCVSVDAGGSNNAPLLTPGIWSFPQGGNQAGLNITLGRAENNLNASFGWHRDTVPVIEAGESPCSDKAIFITDVSIPDDTVIEANDTFTKTWRLENIGSCTWTPEYSLVQVEGDEIKGPEFVPLTAQLAPGETADFSVKLVAPAEPGTYRSDWKLRNPDGLLFGIGPGADKAFWVQIVVE